MIERIRMEEEKIKQQFFPNSSNSIAGIIAIIAGIGLFMASLKVGGGGAASLMAIIAGIVILVRRKKPIITFYEEYVEALAFKKFNVDIVNVERKKSICTLHFVNGESKKINLKLFDREDGEKVFELFEEIVNSNQKKDVKNGN